MKTWDVFISYASEDKEEIATPLYCKLKELGLKVWYDEEEIELSDDIIDKISYGLENSAYFIIILSSNFIKEDKTWTNAEKQIIQYLKIKDKKKVIPIYYHLSPDDLNYEFLFLKTIASIDIDKLNLNEYSSKISEKILNTSVVQVSEQNHTNMMNNNSPFKKSEIESLIISNNLKMASKMIVEFITNYSHNKKLKREALLHQSSIQALNDDIRKFGKTAETEREIRLLKNSLFEFLDIIDEKYV